MAERNVRGRPASPGVAVGPLVRAAAVEIPAKTGSGSPAEEALRFERARDVARKRLADLTARADRLAAEILEFQTEFLADPGFAADVRAEIAEDRSAAAAVATVLDRMIADFRAEESDYLRARAEDLVDLRDRLLEVLAGREEAAADMPAGAILLGRELAPSQFLALARHGLAGIALEAGSVTSHTAMLARARGLPMVVGLGPVGDEAADALLDGDRGLLVLDPSPETRTRYAGRLQEGRAARPLRPTAGPVRTAAGEPVEVRLNVDDPDGLDDAVVAASDGVGLARTEFLFVGRERLPDEEEQYAVYRRLVEKFDGRPVRFRTLDVGGDKPVAGLTPDGETNPFLGVRGIRLCLRHPRLFATQLKALLRAARHGPVEIMLPMVTVPEEVERTRSIVEDLRRELAEAGMPAPEVPLGMMVEVPAAALTLDRFAVDFASIGSNDLVQYVLAVSRDSDAALAELLDPLHPAVRRLIREVVEAGARRGLPVSLCGELAADPDALPVLLELGLRSFSVPPAALARTLDTVARHGGRHGG
jgi:phosphotransferase system enzyme I (PtsI)